VKSRVEKKVQRGANIIISVKKTVQQACFGQEKFIQGEQDITHHRKSRFFALNRRQYQEMEEK
jgi:hypothetical protein